MGDAVVDLRLVKQLIKDLEKKKKKAVRADQNKDSLRERRLRRLRIETFLGLLPSGKQQEFQLYQNREEQLIHFSTGNGGSISSTGRQYKSKVVGRQRKSKGVARRFKSKVVGGGNPSQKVEEELVALVARELFQKGEEFLARGLYEIGRAERLTKEPEKLIGKADGGGDRGKTTLAREVYDHSFTSYISKVVIEQAVVGLREEVEKLIEKLDRGGDKPLEITSIIGPGGGGKTTLAREVYDHSFTSYTSKVVKEKAVVGLREEVEKLIEKLDGGADKPLEIISIIGPGGGGKTTLAREVYDHSFTSYAFEIRAWIDVSQDYNKTRKRDLLIRILDSVIPENYEKSSDDDKLGEDILKCLKGRKYLIVMDDIWSIEAWNDIQRSFPKECKGSKVLFTSRLLVKLESVSYVPHFLEPLPQIWCWKLLEGKVFGEKCCPPELVNIGMRIVEKCKGLPLAVVTIAGILATEDKTPNVWKKVAQHLSSIIAKNEEGCMEILELSYNHLPLHLKACFLYIGGYPEDNEIPVRELIWLWIAEGFIQQSEGGKSLETIAKDYLNNLINRSLVQVARKSPLGGIKACRIHDLLRELCLKKAEDDNFLAKFYEYDSFSPSVTNHHRRVFIGNQLFGKFYSRAQNLHSLRSFLCLSLLGRFDSLVETNLSFFIKNFKLLRVLSFMSATCQGKIGMGHLVHLRYLAYMLDKRGALPFSYLLDLETLNLDFRFEGDAIEDNTIQLPRNIFKMVKLRHLYTKKGVFSFHLSPVEAGSIGLDHSSNLDSLQTLCQVCACETCRSLLVRTPNLRKLGLYGGMLPEDNVLRFPNLDCLECLEKLTFTTEGISNSSRKSTFPPGLKLPLTITRITLKYTCLKWEELSLLQTLPCLEVLKLLDYACSGPVWDTREELEGFPQLKYLSFDYLDIKEWIAFEDQFPKLEVLVIEDCRKLEGIPIDFGNLNELREIMLMDCRSSVEESAMVIEKEQRNRTGDDDCLNLTINGKKMSRVRK